MKSLEVGYWVDEEPYELSDAFPAAQVKISDCRLAVLADSVPPIPENSWPIYARYHNFWYLDKVVKVICLYVNMRPRGKSLRTSYVIVSG